MRRYLDDGLLEDPSLDFHGGDPDNSIVAQVNFNDESQWPSGSDEIVLRSLTLMFLARSVHLQNLISVMIFI